MKNIIKVSVVLALVLCMVLGAVPAFAARWNFEDGVVPEGWDRITKVNDVTATNILNPINENATQEAKSLYAYLCTLMDTQTFVAGQFDIGNDESVQKKLIEEFNVRPGLYSNRYFVYATTPMWGGEGGMQIINDSMNFYDVDKSNELLLKYYNEGHILLVHADSTVRSVCGNQAVASKPELYENNANAVIEIDKTNPDRDMKTYALYQRYLNNTVESLKKLEDMGVKAYMFRPWVEFNLTPFNGVSEDGYAAWTRVWQQTVDAFIDGGLKGFLMTYSPGGYGGTMNRFPGNEYVDIYSVTMYSSQEQLGHLYSPADNYVWYAKTGKPFGLAEWSCRTGAWTVVQEQGRASCFDLLQDTYNLYPNLTWFNFWGSGCYAPIDLDGAGGGNDDGRLLLDSPFTLTLDEIADYQHTVINAPGLVQLYKAKGDYKGLEAGKYNASKLAEMGIKLSEIRAVRVNDGYTVTFYEGSDCTGEYWGYGQSDTEIDAATAARFHSVEVRVIENVALDKAEIYASVNDDDAYRANDGRASTWSGDVYDEENESAPGTAWLMIDLENVYSVSKYVLKNAGYAGNPTMYNTVDYQIQYSKDGENWKVWDSVTGNNLTTVSHTMEQVTGQYFRVYITKPNVSIIPGEEGLVTIADFELYGVDAGLNIKSKYPDGPTLYNDNGAWVYVVDGEIAVNYTGLVNYGGTYYFVNKGYVDWNTETLVNYGGNWWHVKGGKVVFDTTLVNYGGSWYYVGGGKVDFGATGLCNYGGTYYYVNKGVVDFKTETLVNYGGSWWHVKGGKVVFDTTLVNYSGNWYYVGGGKVDFNATGLCNYGGTYYYVNKGVVDFKTETLVNYSGAWWHVKGGKVVFDTTLVKYGNTWYYVQGGKVNFGASGKFNYYGTNYNIKNGVVVF